MNLKQIHQAMRRGEQIPPRYLKEAIHIYSGMQTHYEKAGRTTDAEKAGDTIMKLKAELEKPRPIREIQKDIHTAQKLIEIYQEGGQSNMVDQYQKKKNELFREQELALVGKPYTLPREAL